MSNHAPRLKKPTRKPTSSRVASLIGLLVLAIVLIAIWLATRQRADLHWSNATGHIVSTRVIQTGVHDAGEFHPATIYYQGEARISYTANGKQWTAWLPATERMDNRDWLTFRLSQRKDDQVDVLWNPLNPAQAVATLHYRKP